MAKGKTVKEMSGIFKAIGDKIDAMSEVTVEGIEAALKGVIAEMELKPKDVFMPVRIAVTGRKASPSLFETMAVLGKERCRRRLRNAITHIKQTVK
jgi:glutamyl-tRNA synthetase